jgi:hypothetical protein
VGLLIRRWLWLTFALAPLSVAVVALSHWPLPVRLIALLTPAYMLHQIEEHWGDRFRTFVNTRVFEGREALSEAAVFVINVPLVWGLNLGALAWALNGRLDLALIGVYMMLVNAVVHIVGVARFGYNPGVVTSFVVFAPLSAAIIASTHEPLSAHLIALGVALIGHAAIVIYAVAHARRGQAA